MENNSIEIPNLEKYEAVQLKMLHRIVFKKDNVMTNQIKRGLRKFSGFNQKDFRTSVQFVRYNLSEDNIIDICGILEISATTNTLENIENIIKKLTPGYSNEVEEDSQDQMSIAPSQNSNAARRNSAVVLDNLLDLIRKQSQTIFEMEQEIFDAEDEIQQDNASISQHQLDRLRAKLVMHIKRKEILQSEVEALEEVRSNVSCSGKSYRSRNSRKSESVRNWINEQRNFNSENANDPRRKSSQQIPSQEKRNDKSDSTPSEIKRIVTKNNQDLQLPDFHGESSIAWNYFKLRYEVSTNDFNLSNNENMIRLNTHLKGEARDKVELILKSSKNPSSVIKILQTHYGGSEKMLEEVLEKVRSIKRVSCLNDFRDFNCVVQNIQSVLLHVEDMVFDNQKIMSMLIAKMPDHIVGQWVNLLLTQRISQKDVSFELFSAWIDDYSGIVSEVSFFNAIHAVNHKTPVKVTDLKSMNNYEKEGPSLQRQCKLCKAELHPLANCPQFTSLTPQKRYSTAKKLNFCVCCLNKHYGICKKKQACQINNCGRFHHPLLHFDVNITACSTSHSSNVLLKIINVKIRSGVNEKQVVAFLDEGATVSLIDRSLADEMKIQGIPSPICYEGIGSKVFEDITSQSISLEIGSKDASKLYEISDIHTIRDLRLPTQNLDFDQILHKHPQLRHYALCNQYSSRPQILLSQRHSELIVSRNIIELEKGLMCSKTKLGWAIHGPIDTLSPSFIGCVVEKEINEEKLDELIRNQFVLENHGVNGEKEFLKEDDICLQIAEKSIVKHFDHYEISFPWKDENPKLPNTLPLAMKRINFLEKKFTQDPALKESYTQQIQKLLDRKYASKISFEEIKDRDKVWILPHFAVTNPKKPHKPPRVVFDAAAKVEGKSLNDYLYTGPDWLVSIIGVLIRFREFKIAFAGDIREMFNRIKIREEDSFAQCFLWKNSISKKIELYKMKAMTFGIKSAPFIAQFVKNYNAEQYRQQFPEAYTAIIKNHYVDDYLDCKDTEEEAIQIIKDVINVHQKGGFEIRSFISNSDKVLKKIPPHLVDDNFTISVESSQSYSKILGLNWNARSDRLEFNSFVKNIEKDILSFKKIPTKRDVLKITMSIFDPLGLLCPITIKARLLMQQISNLSISWDSKINEDMFYLWKKWLTSIKELNNTGIPRCYSTTSVKHATRIELHVFCDASSQAYCAVAYFRFIFAGSIQLCLVYAKSRVNPKSLNIGKLSIPKVELIAALLGVRIASTVLSETTLKIDKVSYWTDSSTVMVWLQERKKLPVFQANRVRAILKNSDVNDWNWLSTNVNIADLGTRDNVDLLTPDSCWFKGPEFLYYHKQDWNKYTGKYDKNLNTVEIVMVLERKFNISFCLPPIEKCSSYKKLLNVTAWVGRYLNNLHDKINGNEFKLEPYIDSEDKRWAFNKWVEQLQSETYPNDIIFIKQGIKQNRRLIKQPIKMEGEIMCIDGRLSNCEYISERTKNPIILDGNHAFVKLLVLEMHDEIKHRNFQTLVNNFRQMFWMPKMKLKIKSIVNKCTFCKKRDAKAGQPQMGILPQCRFNIFSKPFTSCGIDYFGPFNVKVGRRLESRYGVLFTCMTSRAIHVEISHTLKTDSCILAIKRMKSRRGRIDEILSDNASNFKCANIELLAAIEEIHPDLMVKELQKIGITWRTIPPRSPNFGGAWERLIGSFKRSVESLFMTNRNPTDEVLHTVFCECEYLINSRPLYSVSEDPLDSTPLTPNDLLIPGEKVECRQGDFSQDELNRKTWRTQQFLIECFWKKFLKEYIPTMLIRSKNEDKTENLCIGDLVHLKGEEIRRGKWPLGRIVKVYPGKDSVVRVVDVKVGEKVFKRAANQLSLCRFEN